MKKMTGIISIFLLAAAISGLATYGFFQFMGAHQEIISDTDTCTVTVYADDGSVVAAWEGEAENFRLEDGEQKLYEAEAVITDGTCTIKVFDVNGATFTGAGSIPGELPADGTYSAVVAIQ